MIHGSPLVAKTAVYRLYDKEGVLLYVGMSDDPAARWRMHRIEKTWWPAVARKTVEWFDERTEAAKAEARAIRDEAPVYNRALPDEDGSGGWRLAGPRKTRRRTVPPSGLRRFTTSPELWERFAQAVGRSADPEADMSKVLRQFVRWYGREPGADLPERPQPLPHRTE